MRSASKALAEGDMGASAYVYFIYLGPQVLSMLPLCVSYVEVKSVTLHSLPLLSQGLLLNPELTHLARLASH